MAEAAVGSPLRHKLGKVESCRQLASTAGGGVPGGARRGIRRQPQLQRSRPMVLQGESSNLVKVQL
jgi:hypothetical protein